MEVAEAIEVDEATFLAEAVKASQCYFFEKRLINLKCSNLPNVLLPFLNLEDNFSWPFWISKYAISSLSTLYTMAVQVVEFSNVG